MFFKKNCEWIKFYLNDDFLDDLKLQRVWISILKKVRLSDQYGLNEGDLIFNYRSWAREFQKCRPKITIQNLRTIIKKLVNIGEITIKVFGPKNKQVSVVTVLNYHLYKEALDLCLKDQGSLKEKNKKINAKNEAIENISKEFVQYLNDKAGKNFNIKSKDTLKKISALFNEGYNDPEKYKKAVDGALVMCVGRYTKDGTPCEFFLNPKIILRISNFEMYLNAGESVAQDVFKELVPDDQHDASLIANDINNFNEMMSMTEQELFEYAGVDQ